MKKRSPHNYNPEKLKLMERQKLNILRENAVRLGAVDLLQMCDDELAGRAPQKPRTKRQAAEHSHENMVVSGYHFVCSRDRGVSAEPDGKFWSGAWVVSEKNVQESLRYGAYLALHDKKSDPSYRQGTIIEYRRAPREMVGKADDGIEFLVQEDSEPREWVGFGAGEKGYKWHTLIAKEAPGPNKSKDQTP